MVFLFGPAKVFRFGVDDITISLVEVYTQVLPPLLVACVLSSFAVYKCKGFVFQKVQSFLTVLCVLLCLQATFFVWDYGKLDGTPIVWSSHQYIAVFEACLWASALFSSFLFFNWAKKWSAILLTVILLIYGLTFAYYSSTFGRMWSFRPPQGSSDAFYKFSKERNVLFIVLDGFQSTVLDRVFNEKPEFKDGLDGFTFFSDHLGAFQNTYVSIPAMLSGQLFDNSEPTVDFIKKALGKESLPWVLADAGYDEQLTTLIRYCAYFQSDHCFGEDYYAVRDAPARHLQELARVIDVSLFQTLPDYAKRFIYRDQGWFFQSLFFRKLTGSTWHEEAISLTDSVVSYSKVGAEKPTFKFLHLIIPHSPFLLDVDCNAFKNSELHDDEKYWRQATCAFGLAFKMLEKIKALGVYDQSLIVIAADHGLSIPIGVEGSNEILPGRGIAYPLLLVKPPGAKGALKISTNPTWISDIPKTILSLLGIQSRLPGESAFDLENKPRARKFHFFTDQTKNVWTSSYYPPLEQYEINGRALSPLSWKRLGTLKAPQ